MSNSQDSTTLAAALALFNEAADIADARERTALLDVRCAGDSVLRGLVEGLLAADAGSSGVLDQPAAVIARQLLSADGAPAIDARIGQSIGAFRLDAVLGQGGMGTVFAASREGGGFTQTVALKLIRAGFDDASARRRFERERQILSGLKHPDIAGLLDGGVLDDGQPWYAMERVEGMPITRWCDDQRLDLAARIALVARVCDAVQAAHQQLVVHRDLKPSNILVDGAGSPHLLDFGIAKLLDEPGGDEPRTVTRLMTPEYAAPEQIRGEAVGTATDVFALGVVLYELLTGARPFAARDGSPFEVQRSVLEQDPARLSVAISADQTTSGARARARRASVPRLRRLLLGDIERVVRKALAKAPGDRYPTAAAFADDLRRYLNGHPVLATTPSPIYRARKFIARHRVSVAALTLAVVVMVGATIFSLQQARAAKAEAARATAVQEFLIGLFEQQRPDETKGASISAKDLLDRAEQKLDAGTTLSDDSRGALLYSLSRLRYDLGDFEGAARLADSAVTLARSHFGPDSPGYANALIERADALDQADRTSDALADCARALPLLAADDDTGRLRGLALDSCADFNRQLEHFADAQAMLDESEPLLARYGEDRAERERKTLHSRAMLANDRHQYDRAVASWSELIARVKDDPASAPSELATALHSRAVGYEHLGQAQPSLSDFRAALAIHRQIFGQHHPLVVNTQSRLALSLFEAGEYEAAAANSREAVKIAREIFPANSSTLGIVLSDAAFLAYRQLDLATAASLLQEAGVVMTKAHGATHSDTLAVLNNLSSIQRKLGRYDQARASAREVLTRLGPGKADSVVARQSHLRLAWVATAEGAFAQAEDEARLVVAPSATQNQADGGDELDALSVMAMAQVRLGEAGDARATATEVETRARARLAADDATLKELLGGLSWIAQALGERERASALSAEALGDAPIAAASWSRSYVLVAALVHTHTLIDAGRMAEAETWRAALRERRERAPADESIFWDEAAVWLDAPGASTPSP